jgi:hypothetical protein
MDNQELTEKELKSFFEQHAPEFLQITFMCHPNETAAFAVLKEVIKIAFKQREMTVDTIGLIKILLKQIDLIPRFGYYENLLDELQVKSFSLYEALNDAGYFVDKTIDDFFDGSTQEQIQTALYLIPVELRIYIILRDIEVFNYEEISEITSLPVEVCMERVERTRKLFQYNIWNKILDTAYREKPINRSFIFLDEV